MCASHTCWLVRAPILVFRPWSILWSPGLASLRCILWIGGWVSDYPRPSAVIHTPLLACICAPSCLGLTGGVGLPTWASVHIHIPRGGCARLVPGGFGRGCEGG